MSCLLVELLLSEGRLGFGPRRSSPALQTSTGVDIPWDFLLLKNTQRGGNRSFLCHSLDSNMQSVS